MRWLCVAAGIALILAIIPSWSYDYYVLLRWFISISSIIVAYGFYQSKFIGWTFAFGAIAFLFNPIFPVFLTRPVWTPIDLIGAVLFFIAGYSIKK